MKVRSSVFATFILICEAVGVALFLRGFFPVPVKSSLSSKSKLSDLPAEPLTGALSSLDEPHLPRPALSWFPAPTPKKEKGKYLFNLASFYFTGGTPNSTRLPKPLFRRVVIMLVDALREDFVFGPSGRMNMPYTRHLVERGSSNSYVARARLPTVTMPRIKVSQALFVITKSCCALLTIQFLKTKEATKH